jgi:hypothetical protein
MKRVEEGVDYIVVTKNLKVFISGPVEIPASHSIIAEKLINTPPAEEKKMKEALASQAKKVSVSGRIIQVRNFIDTFLISLPKHSVCPFTVYTIIL